jgi:sulfur-carrier protein
MTITVRLFASFQEITGVNREEVESDSVGEMLNRLVDIHPELEEEVFTSTDRTELRPRVKVMIDGRNIDFLSGLETGVKETDRVAVFPPVGGG